jgi:hypothetical protein
LKIPLLPLFTRLERVKRGKTEPSPLQNGSTRARRQVLPKVEERGFEEVCGSISVAAFQMPLENREEIQTRKDR